MMDYDNVLDCFMEGFAKTAEAAGVSGAAVRSLMELSVDLAQREAHPAEFDAGFAAQVAG